MAASSASETLTPFGYLLSSSSARTLRPASVVHGCGDELDNCAVAAERLAPPVYRDEREQPVLDLVPFAGARR